MSTVSRAKDGGPSGNSYDDFHVLNVQQTARVVNATDTGGSFTARQMEPIPTNRNDTLSLNHDEMAELVGLHILAYRAYIDDNDYADAENYRSMLSIGINRALDGDFLQDNDLETDNIGTADELAGRTRLDDDPATLFRAHGTYLNADSEVAQGDVALMPNVSDVYIPFRERFGQGPLLDSNDEIVHGAGFNGVALGGNGNVVFVIDWTAYFDIFEVERLRR